MKKALLVISLLITLSSFSLAPPPDLPHRVYGNISDTDGPEGFLGLDFHHNNSSVKSTTSEADGGYSIKIPYNTTYEDKKIELYIDDKSTGKSINFSSGTSEKLNYTGRNLLQEPFELTGTITINGSTSKGYTVSAYHDSNNITSDTTESDGGYKLTIPFSDSYDGEELSLYVRGTDTGEVFSFQTDGSGSIDYSEDGSEDNDDNDNTVSDNNNETDNETENETEDEVVNGSDSDNTKNSPDSVEGKASISIQGFEISPKVAEVGENVNIEVTVKNSGDAAGSYDLEIKIGNTTLTRNAPNIGPGEEEKIQISESFEQPGDYTIGSGDNKVSLSIEEPEGGLSLFQIMGLISVILFLIVGIYKGYQMFGGLGFGGKNDEESKGAFDSFRDQKENGEEEFSWRYQDEE